MLFHPSHTYEHVITGSDIWLEVQEIMAALCKSGYDPSDLDLEEVATQAKVREIKNTAEYYNITIGQLRWSKPNWHGDVEVQIAVPTDADLVMLRLAL
jgi:hypothetical protein